MKVIKIKVKKQRIRKRRRKRRTKQWKGKMMKKYKELLIKWTQPTLLLLLFLYFLSVTLLVIQINQQEKTMKMSYQLNQLFLRFSFSSKQNFHCFFPLIQGLILIKTLNSPLTPLAPLNLITKTAAKKFISL